MIRAASVDQGSGSLLLGGQVEQFPVTVPFQEAIESLYDAGLEVRICLDDVLHVGADEDQTAGAALAVADRNPGTDAGLRNFEFGLLLRQFPPLAAAPLSRTDA